MSKITISVLLCSVAYCTVQAIDSKCNNETKEYKIIPHIIPESVPELLKVTFDNNIVVDMGTEVTPFQTRNPPVLDWNADENAFYTVIELDPDVPSADDPYYGLLNIWMVGNIPGKDVNAGEVLVEYVPGATPRGRGFQRYAIFVYKQPGRINFTENHIDKYHFEERLKFPVKEFVSKYGLGRPVAGNFFKTQYDPFVNFVYTQLRCCFDLNKY